MDAEELKDWLAKRLRVSEVEFRLVWRRLERMTPEERATWDEAYGKEEVEFNQVKHEKAAYDQWKLRRYMEDYLRCIVSVDESVGQLLDYLEARRGQACSRDEIAQHLYPDDMLAKGGGVSDARLDAVVKRLRKHIEPVKGKPQFIITVRGHGFRLED